MSRNLHIVTTLVGIILLPGIPYLLSQFPDPATQLILAGLIAVAGAVFAFVFWVEDNRFNRIPSTDNLKPVELSLMVLIGGVISGIAPLLSFL